MTRAVGVPISNLFYLAISSAVNKACGGKELKIVGHAVELERNVGKKVRSQSYGTHTVRSEPTSWPKVSNLLSCRLPIMPTAAVAMQ